MQFRIDIYDVGFANTHDGESISMTPHSQLDRGAINRNLGSNYLYGSTEISTRFSTSADKV